METVTICDLLYLPLPSFYCTSTLPSSKFSRVVHDGSTTRPALPVDATPSTSRGRIAHDTIGRVSLFTSSHKEHVA